MNDTIRMQISAFVDGELPDNESELLMRRLSQDAELRQVVAHYLEIGRYVRREAELPQMAQLRERIAEALGEETHATDIPAAVSGRSYVKPLAGFAVAATVALLAIFGLQQSSVPIATDAETVAEGAYANTGSYTQPSADLLLDEMFRRHENSPLLQRVAYEFDEAELVKVDSQAKLLSPVEIDSEIDEDDEDEKQKESKAD